MQKIYTIITLLALFTSCNYLEVTPVGKVIPDKASEYRALMTSAYSKVTSHKRLTTVRADEVLPYNFGPLFSNFVDIALWNDVTPDPVTASYSWTEMYNVIFYANSVIADVMDATVDTPTESLQQLKGEALLLRAYMHFELVNLYGKYYTPATAATDRGVPLALKIDIDQAYKPATVEEVYRQVLADIAEGTALMTVEAQPAATRYRFSIKAAKALEARVRLFKMDWTEALRLAEELIPTCPLADLNSTTAVTPPYYYNSEEAILATDGVGLVDMVNDMYMAPDFMAHYNTEKTDNRYLDARVGIYFKQGYDGSFIAKKYGSDKGERSTLRSAELYLIAAEAAAHLPGKQALAKSYLKRLLQTRLESGYYTQRVTVLDGLNDEALLTEILDERGRELALEGLRWYDLRRTTRPRIVKSFFNANFDELSGTLEKDDARYTIRIPKEATENNPNLNR